MKKLHLILALFCTFTQVVAQVSTRQLLRSAEDNTQLPLDPNLKPFYHGVASGDPLNDRVIIWTRVTPDEAGDVEVEWRISRSADFRNIEQSGTLTTNENRDYTVKIEVENLEPATTYYFYFSALGANSIVGRTRTTPSSDEVAQLRFAVVSCSNYQAGYFNAYRHIGERQDLDAVIHLGDYIYEYGSGEGTYGFDPSRADRSNIPDTEILELVDYRTRYSLYRLDPDLRKAHQQHPFIAVWDDHESANDSYVDGAENHDNDTEGSWSDRKSISKKVYFEWMPIREGSNEKIYRTIRYGDLADLIMVDTRLEGRDEQINDVTNPLLYSPDRTLLGADQKSWLKDQLNESSAKWKVIGNQVIFSEFHVGWAATPETGTPEQVESIFLDIWDGYPAERNELISFIKDQNINNTVWLTGDFHSSFAFDVALFPSPFSTADPLYVVQEKPYSIASRENSIAIEFATPSITSANFDENLDPATSAALEFQFNKDLPSPPLPENTNPNPHMRYVDLDQHGYFVLDLTHEKAQADYFYTTILEKDQPEEGGAYWFANVDENFLNKADSASVEKNEAPELAPDAPFVITNLSEISATPVVLSMYPNPADIGNTLHINYATLSTNEIEISVRGSKGDLIETLYSGKVHPGNYTLSTELKQNYRPGLYFLQISSSDQLTTRKLILR